MRSKSAALMAPASLSSCGRTALASTRNRGISDERHSSEKIESIEEEPISPRSRKSRRASATSSATTSPICAARRRACSRSGETALEPSTEATVNNVNSLIQRVAGTSLSRNRKPDRRTRKPARPPARRRPARPARDFRLCPAQPGRHEVHAHDRRQCGAVETHRGRPSQQLIYRASDCRPRHSGMVRRTSPQLRNCASGNLDSGLARYTRARSIFRPAAIWRYG